MIANCGQIIKTKIIETNPESFHSDRQTDMTKLIVALRNFASGPRDRFFAIFRRNFSTPNVATMQDCFGMYTVYLGKTAL
jgi:hypothetical protein